MNFLFLSLRFCCDKVRILKGPAYLSTKRCSDDSEGQCSKKEEDRDHAHLARHRMLLGSDRHIGNHVFLLTQKIIKVK